MNKACGSGLKSMLLAAESIQLGRADVVVAGGVESMSGVPFSCQERTGYRLGHAGVADAMYKDGFHCPLANMLMGETAEKLAPRWDHARRAGRVRAAPPEEGRRGRRGRPLPGRDRRRSRSRQEGRDRAALDEHARPDATIESSRSSRRLRQGERQRHRRQRLGDHRRRRGAVVIAEDAAEDHGLTPARAGSAVHAAGVDPRVMGVGPVPAVQALLARTGLSPEDFDLIELNEAFAAQVLACHREMPLPMDRLNVNGGAIALGHPIGATGARIVVTLLHEMKRRKARRGLATLCISGGMGLATAFHAEPA